MKNSLAVALGTTLVAARALLAQAPAQNVPVFAALANDAVCTEIPASDALKRGGTWQLFQLQSKHPARMVMIGMDAKQRTRMVSEMSAGKGLRMLQIDSTAAKIVVGPRDGDLTEADRAAAIALARDARRRCSPLPKIVDAGRAIPPAAHTGVLANIEHNQPTCRTKPIAASSNDFGVARLVVYNVKQPSRMFVVSADAKDQPVKLTATVSWGAMSSAERETAEAIFNSNGTVASSSLTLGYEGKGAHVLLPDEKEKALAIAREVLKHCIRSSP